MHKRKKNKKKKRKDEEDMWHLDFDLIDMFPPHGRSPVQSEMNPFFNNLGHQNNPGMYGRHTPHMPPNSAFIPPGLPSAHNGPPPPHMMSGWNGGFHMPPPPPPQGPFNPLHHHNHHRPPPMQQHLPPNLMNYHPNRHQFNLHQSHLGNQPFHCPPPQNAFGPPHSSQFMVPPSQFPGGPETFHQGYVTAGGPYSSHHNDAPFYTHHDHRNMTNFMGPPSFMPVNNRPPMIPPYHGTPFDQFQPHKPDLSQSGFNDICGHYGITPVTIPKSFHGKIINDETVKNTVFSPMDDNGFNEEMFEHLQQQETNDPFDTDTSIGGLPHNQNPVRMTTPSANILERNTAVNFDESSEELAEIFGNKPTNNDKITQSRASSKASSKQSSSSSLFNSDEENFQSESKDKVTRAAKASKKKGGSITDDKEKQSDESKQLESCDHIRPPPGFAHIKPGSAPTEDQLSKAGHIIKGMLKIDIKKGNRGSSTSPHEGNTIRSMIHQPIYSNCESRLIKQEPEIRLNEPQSEISQVLNSANTGQTRYIQRITTHFRILFEPIPDMFGDN